MEETKKFNQEDFDEQFKIIDRDNSGAIDRKEMFDFIQKVAGFDPKSLAATEEAMKKEE